MGGMNWKDITAPVWKPLRATFALSLAERRVLLGILLLFCLGLAARYMHQQQVRSRPHPAPLENPRP